MTISDMEALLQKTIPQLQQKLREMDKIEKISVEDMKDLLRLEKLAKNRRGVASWLEVGIIQGRLPSEFYLDFQAKTGLYKSALQKYIRRGNVEKAIRTAKTLFLLSRDQSIRRLKIIVVEDAFSAVEILRFFSDDMNLETYLRVVAAVAEAPKDKSLCPLGWELTEGSLVSRVAQATPNVEWLKTHLLDQSEYVEVVIQLFQLAKDKRFNDVENVFDYDQDVVVRQCLDRIAQGTFWPSDSALLLMAAIRYRQGDYLLKNLTLPQINPNEVQSLRLSEIDWFCCDSHSHVGRVAERFFLARHKEITQKMLQSIWFHGESARLGGEIIADWPQPYDKELWATIKHEVKQTVEDVMFKKFKFREIDEQESLRWPQK